MKQEERYNAALEKVKGLLKDQEIALHAREKLANVFPELKESEDDKTRKEILNVFKQLDEGTTICGRNYDYAKWIAWLEKQKPNTRKREIDDAYPHETWIFIDGAHWADQHPSTETINRIIELYKRWYSQQCDTALTDYIKQNY